MENDSPSPVTTEEEKPNYPIASVDNALRLLRMFEERPALTMAEASRELGVARSTAHRLLAMLAYHRFVWQDPVTKAFVPGNALIQVGLSVVRKMNIRSLARPLLESLAARTGETVHVVGRQDASVIFLDGVESKRALRAGNRTGDVMPANCTAGGKALLAFLDAGQLAAVFPGEALPVMTGLSIGKRGDLERELDTVRNRGYATNREESEPGITAIAAGVVDRFGRPRASITVTAPTSRIPGEWPQALVDDLIRTTAQLGDSLD
jgi:DNA-binding IclR family transcriptional regulator